MAATLPQEHVASRGDPDGFIVVEENVLGHDLDVFSQRVGSSAGVRQYLSPGEGSGYWDLVRLDENVIVSVTHASYRRDFTLAVDCDDVLKARLVLSGRLCDASGRVITQAPQGLLHLHGEQGRWAYTIDSSHELKMVVLHCRRTFVPTFLGLRGESVPPPFDRLMGLRDGPSSRAFALSPELLRISQKIVSCRYDVPAIYRPAYLTALCTEMLCTMFSDLGERDAGSTRHPDLSARDVSRVLEARDYLLQNFVSPPRIAALARLIGINQTKLKDAFRKVMGHTIYDYVLKLRMERAAELLAAGESSIAEIAYRVGYEYPANFTGAFKTYYGTLPRDWRRRSLAGSESSHDVP